MQSMKHSITHGGTTHDYWRTLPCVFKPVRGMASAPFLGLSTSTTSLLSLFEAFVQPGPDDNIFPPCLSPIVLSYSNL